MSMPELPPPEHNDPHARWRFIRDVLYFQLKLVLGNLQNFLLLPVSLAAALADLLFKGEREGQRFYWVLDWGRRTDEAINIYGAIGGYGAAILIVKLGLPGRVTGEPGSERVFLQS